jgi:hypothetical protein
VRHRFAFLVLALVLTAGASSEGARAQSGDIPCGHFIRNPDGSWTVASNVRFPAAGQMLNLQQGSVMRPGFYILGNDIASVLAKTCASVPVQQPQAEIATLADNNGVIDMETLTCGQLLSVYQEDVDFLMAWYSGWSNGLAKNHTLKVQAVKDATHNVILYCKANTGKRIVDAIEALTKQSQR